MLEVAETRVLRLPAVDVPTFPLEAEVAVHLHRQIFCLTIFRWVPEAAFHCLGQTLMDQILQSYISIRIRVGIGQFEFGLRYLPVVDMKPDMGASVPNVEQV